MYSFVARQPILDEHQRPVAYELLFRKGLSNAFPNVTAEQATTCLIAEQFLSQPIQQLVGDHRCYINFPYSLLLNGLADSLPREQVVIEILEDAEPDQQLFDCVRGLKDKGFRLALDDFTLDPRWERFLPYIDIIKFDFRLTSHDEMAAYIAAHKHTPLIYLAEKVETQQEFMAARQMGFTLFQGYFFSRPEIVQRKTLSESQLTVMQLLKEVNAPELDYVRIEELLNRDLSLAYKLMRYVNNLRYRAADPITSFRHATVFLGQQEMRRFVSLVSATSGGENKSTELYRMSLIRGRFCELLSLHRQGWTDPAEAFLCGLFSLLEAILDQPFVDILAQIPLSDQIKQALLEKRGELAFYLAFVTDYETLNWDRLKLRAEKIQLSEEQTINLFLEASKWADQVMSSH
ncbi:EAL and HDOD domain-containing protein [Pseudaeromonas sharmana]|uniref:EAL and HDOD domain-containing protein n=1 Tax=Pseudaeromonas sharmana TaxID=328412 RepID=A0ABV8CNW8_9GAMM